jgi:hypothetical protein
VYEVLHQEASIISAKLDEKRRQATESEIKLCTFQPKLVSEPLVKEGKIKKVSKQPAYHILTTNLGTDSYLCLFSAMGNHYRCNLLCNRV